MKNSLILIIFAFVVGCTETAADRYLVDSPEITERQRIGYSSVEIRDVSLPAYAASDEISVQDETGKIVSDGSVLWADTPERAVSLQLTRALTQLTRARIASEPWPFEEFPQARLDVRFETMLPRNDGVYQIEGQYFVSSEEGRERAGLFDLNVDLPLDAGPAQIAQARGIAIAQLAQLIASKGLR